MAKDLSDTQIVQDQMEKLLSLMQVDAEISVSEEKDGNVFVQIQAGEDSGLLIGKYGRTVESLELLANLSLKQKKGEWRRVVVNVSDWKEKEERRLIDLAQNVAARAAETGEPQYLYNLSSSQRRTIHMILAENPNVVTASEGDGGERYLIVSPKEASDSSAS